MDMSKDYTDEKTGDFVSYSGDEIDDVALTGVSMFRLERMSDNTIWIRVYRESGDVVFWLGAKGGKIVGHHDLD